MFSKLTNYISSILNGAGDGYNGYFLSNPNYLTLQKDKVVFEAMQNPYYSAILNDIAESGSNMPLILTDKNGVVLDANDTNLVILNTPNEELNSTANFIERMLRCWLTFGDVLVYTEDYAVGGFTIAELDFTDASLLYCPKNIDWSIQEGSDGKIKSFWVKNGQTQLEVNYERALFVAKDNFISNSKYGLSPLSQSQVAIASSNELFYTQERLFKNLGTSGLLASKGDIPLLQDEKEAMQQVYDNLTTGHNKFKTKIVGSGVEYIRTGANFNDVQASKYRVEDLRIAASVFGVPSQCFGDTHRAYNNTEEAYIQKDNVVADYVNYLCKELVKYLTNDENLILQVDRKKVPRLAKQDVETKQKNDLNIISHYQSGILTAQEAREKIYPDLPPLPENQTQNSDGNEE